MTIIEAVNEIKERIDIVEFISNYIELKKTGRNYKALCPFHTEKTPSFIVNPEKQFFYCFGCGVGGDIITFIMKYEGIGFYEAILLLAEKTGIKIDAFGSFPTSKKKELLKIYHITTKYFREKLNESIQAKKYISERGLTKEIIKNFLIGYAPANGKSLYKYLLSKGFSDYLIIESGLCKKIGNKILDTFKGRVIFPIINVHGEVIAYGGRIICDKQAGPKYLNSPETLLFKKSAELFGLYQAKEEIRKKGYVIIMEGYLDVITSYQYGIKNVVATLGTSITETQVKKIKSLTDKAILVFDADQAGLKASKRALSLLYETGITAKVMLLPKGEDPDSFLRKYGIKKFKNMYAGVKDIIDFYFSLKEDKNKLVKELIDIIFNLKDIVLKSSLLKKTSERFKIPENFLIEEIKNKRKKQKIGINKKEIKVYDAEQILLAIYFSYPEYMPLIKKKLTPDMLRNPIIKSVYSKLYSSLNTDINQLLQEKELSFISKALVNINLDKDEIEKNIVDCIKKIKKDRIKEQITTLQMKIKEAEMNGKNELLENFQRKMLSLLKEYKNMEKI